MDHGNDLDPKSLSGEPAQQVPFISLARYGAVSPDGLHWRVLRVPLMIIRSGAKRCGYRTDRPVQHPRPRQDLRGEKAHYRIRGHQSRMCVERTVVYNSGLTVRMF